MKTQQTFRMTVLFLVVLIGSSCVSPRHSSVGAPSGITAHDAVRVARQALAERRLFLPKGAYANVEESYADHDPPHPRPIFGVTFFINRSSGRASLYSLSIDRESGQVRNIIDLKRDIVIE